MKEGSRGLSPFIRQCGFPGMYKKLQWLQIWRLAIAVALLVAVALFERDAGSRSFMPALAPVVGALLVLSAFYFLALRHRFHYDRLGYVQLWIDLALITWLVYHTGDVESPFLALYLVAIFAASALFGKRGVTVLGAAGAALYACVSTLTMNLLIPRADGWDHYDGASLSSAQFIFATNLMAICVVALLSSHLSERARRSESLLATATKELADNRLFNDRIIESVRSGLVTTNLGGEITTFNRASEEITGYKSSDVRGRNIFEIFGDIRKQIEVGLESIRTRSRLPRFDIGCKAANGGDIHLGFSVAPLVDESGEARGYVLTFQDLTEVMELEREVRRQERLAALGKMAAGLAHEIRNPLASMRGSVQVLASELSLSPDQSQLMEIVLRESDRLNRIVSDFLTYARPPRTERTVIELSSILSETVALLRNSTELRQDHSVVEDYPSEAVHYYGDPNQIRQIFWNLTRNSIQAMSGGGELRVILEANRDQDVTITFSDSGSGMTREQKDRLFEPFSSSSGGTGLGMAIVYQLVSDHRGKILVDSESGKGTSISIKLPVEGRVTRDEESASDAAPRPGSSSPVAVVG